MFIFARGQLQGGGAGGGTPPAKLRLDFVLGIVYKVCKILCKFWEDYEIILLYNASYIALF